MLDYVKWKLRKYSEWEGKEISTIKFWKLLFRYHAYIYVYDNEWICMFSIIKPARNYDLCEENIITNFGTI